ncbi:hypothetical protein ACFX18_06445 [Lactococcus garvieae]|uniref:hypothetical protein n=1 Tax=Lactococcus garvieae TaxID=1363 RepID=UPI003D16C1DA
MKKLNIPRWTYIAIPLLACLIFVVIASLFSPSSTDAKNKDTKTTQEHPKKIPDDMIEIPDISLKSKEEADALLKQAGVKVQYVTGNFADDVSEYTTFIPKNTVDYDESQKSVKHYSSGDGWDMEAFTEADYINKSDTLIVKVADMDYKYRSTDNTDGSSKDTSNTTFQPTTVYDEGGIKLEQTNWNSFKVTNNTNQVISVKDINLDIDGQEVNPWSLGLLWKDVAVGKSIIGSITDYDGSGLLTKGKTLHGIIEFDDEDWNALGTAEFNLVLENTIK